MKIDLFSKLHPTPRPNLPCLASSYIKDRGAEKVVTMESDSLKWTLSGSTWEMPSPGSLKVLLDT